MIETDSAERFRVAAANINAPRMDEGSHAFDSLYSTYVPLLRKIAVGRFGIPRSDADALVHDVFTTYLANPANVRDVHPYLIGAICNAARQYQRREAAERALFCDSDECEAEPSKEMVDGVISTIVANATLARLGESCRDTLRRFYFLGETAPCIAASRNTSANYVLRLLHYCRKRARAMYDGTRKES